MILYLKKDKLYNKKVVIKESSLSLLVESTNSKRAHQQTRRLIANALFTDANENTPEVVEWEQNFEKECFDEGKRVDWFIVLEPNFFMWFNEGTFVFDILKEYINYIFRKATTFEKPSEYIAQIRPITTFEQLKAFIDPQMEEDKAIAKEQMNNMEVNLNQNYQVLGPLSFEEAKPYGKETAYGGLRICYTQNIKTWNSISYSNNGENSCYLLLRNDWEKYNNNPQLAIHDGSEVNNGLGELSKYNGYDDYGLSMIFVWITPEGELHECNTRWNHRAKYAPGHGVDSALNEVDIANLMGAPFGKVFNIGKI